MAKEYFLKVEVLRIRCTTCENQPTLERPTEKTGTQFAEQHIGHWIEVDNKLPDLTIPSEATVRYLNTPDIAYSGVADA